MGKKNLTISSKVRCPYYRGDDHQKIYCDGYSQRMVCEMAFYDRGQKAEYKAKVCIGDYTQCRHYRSM